MWIPLELQNWSCTTLTVDLPGHGKSMDYLPEGDPSIDKIADAVVELLGFLEIKEFNLIGHSMGGYIGLSIKKRCNGCRKLVLMNSTYLADNEDKIRDRLRMAFLVFEAKSLIVSQSIPRLFYIYSADDQLVCDLIKEAQLIKPEAIAYASIAMSKRAQNIDLVIEHKEDVLIIYGKHDNIINVSQLQIDAMKFGLQLTELSNSGHMSHFEETEILKTTLINFFST